MPSPDRLVIDLPPVDWLKPPAHLEQLASLLPGVESIRHGWFQPGTYRIVLDLPASVSIERAGIENGAKDIRLAVTWRPAPQFREQRFGDFVEPPIPPERPGSERSYRRLPLIVIDPGHGGVDPGAIGAAGTREKHITLYAAQTFAERLLQTGRYRVRLTRDTDRFIRLRERVAIARRLDADLFISVHADSALERQARGLSVYTLSRNASDKEAAALAQRENKADVLAGVDLSDEQDSVVSILIDLAQRETQNRSMRFANRLVQAAATRMDVLPRAHRQAGFAVLKAPDIPSVLVELGFLTNPDEERLLNSPEHIALIAEGLTATVDSFFAEPASRGN